MASHPIIVACAHNHQTKPWKPKSTSLPKSATPSTHAQQEYDTQKAGTALTSMAHYPSCSRLHACSHRHVMCHLASHQHPHLSTMTRSSLIGHGLCLLGCLLGMLATIAGSLLGTLCSLLNSLVGFPACLLGLGARASVSLLGLDLGVLCLLTNEVLNLWAPPAFTLSISQACCSRA